MRRARPGGYGERAADILASCRRRGAFAPGPRALDALERAGFAAMSYDAAAGSLDALEGAALLGAAPEDARALVYARAALLRDVLAELAPLLRAALGRGGTYGALLSELARRAGRDGAEVKDAFCLGGSRWLEHAGLTGAVFGGPEEWGPDDLEGWAGHARLLLAGVGRGMAPLVREGPGGRLEAALLRLGPGPAAGRARRPGGRPAGGTRGGRRPGRKK